MVRLGLTSQRHVPVEDAIGEFLRGPSEVSFVPVYQGLYGRVWRYFRVRGLDASTAEDLCQDVLMTVYRRAKDLRTEVCFLGWLFRVARNCMLQHTRKQHPECESLSGLEFRRDVPNVPAQEFGMGAGSDLFEWMHVLDDAEREICLMRYVDDLEYEAISNALQLPMGTVKWKLHRIKNKIAARIADKTKRST
jgi:RNA polymerase sigma factor (sigma-70 family)